MTHNCSSLRDPLYLKDCSSNSVHFLHIFQKERSKLPWIVTSDVLDLVVIRRV